MHLLVLLLLVGALALLVLGLISSSTPLVVASIVASLLAAYAIVRYQRRREAAPRPEPAQRSEAASRPEQALRPGPVADQDRRPPAAAPPVASERSVAVAAASVATKPPDRECSYEDEPAAAQTEPPLETHHAQPVWVIDGRPRYHLSSCIFIIGRRPEPVSLSQAVEDGFSPCSQCDPDTALVAG